MAAATPPKSGSPSSGGGTRGRSRGSGRGRGRGRKVRWTKPPKPARSPSSAPPPHSASPSALGPPAPPLLPPGAEVEVRVDDDGFHGSWFEATVLDFSPGRGRRSPACYSVEYVHLVADDGVGGLSETFAPSHIRPRPPPPSESTDPTRFRPDDIVEAFHNEGWWSGIVVSSAAATADGGDGGGGGVVTVAFPITREVIEFQPNLVRPRLDYVGGDWIPSRVAMAVRPSRAVKVYEVGDKVEVVKVRDLYGQSWFPATVARVIDDLSYVVEYNDLEEEDVEGAPEKEKATEYLHWKFIRPAVEHSPSESEFQLCPDAAVEAYCDGAWSPGVVQRVLPEGEYEIVIVGNKSQMLVTKVVPLLKPQYKWNGNRWRIAIPKKRRNLRGQSMSGKSPSTTVDVSSSDEENSLENTTLAEGSEHASMSGMDNIFSALCKSPESTQGSHGIVNPVPMNGLLCAPSGYSTPVNNQELLSDMVVPDGKLNGPGRSADTHDKISIAELRKQMASARRSSAGRIQENLVKSLRVKKCISNIKAGKTHPIQELQGKIQLKGNMNLSGPDIVLALGVSGNGQTTLSPDTPVSRGTKRGSSTKVLACKKLRRESKELCCPNSSLDVTSTVQVSGRKEVAEPMTECPLALECPQSDTLEQLNRTLENAQNITELSNQEDWLPMVPPGFASNGNGTNRRDTQFEERPAGMINSLIQPNATDDMSTDHAATTLAKRNHVMDSDILSLDCLAQQARGEVDERSVSLHLQNTGSSQCTTDSSPLMSCSALERLLPSPVGPSQESNHQALFDKSSHVWPVLERMHVFKELPQQPHFIPLKKYPPSLREGMASGLMMSFLTLESKLPMEASIDESMEWFDDKIRSIEHLKENGFCVQSLQNTVTEMVKIKSEVTGYSGQLDKLNSELVDWTDSSSRAGELLDEKDAAVAKLERELGRLRQESQKIAKEKEKIDAVVGRIRTAASGFEDLCSSGKRKFNDIVAGLRRKRLT